MTDQPAVGDVLSLEVGPVANGGQCVARHNGQVVFVRGALPGELVTVELSSVGSRFARADVVSVERPSPDRVEPPCPVAGRCGGCDWQHASEEAQRELKRQVVADLLRQWAGYEWTGSVEAVPPAQGWRTRMRFRADETGRLGLRAHRSHDLVALHEHGCVIAHPAIPRQAPEAGEWIGLVSAEGPRLVSPGTGATVSETVGNQRFRVAADGFWQSHLAAPALLTEAVLDALAPVSGERALDLYCGVGLFSAALVEAGCQVLGIEGDATAVAHARRNVPGAEFQRAGLPRGLHRVRGDIDLVVLDPPRAGAGVEVMDSLAAKQPRRIAYVSCDPATLARDLGQATRRGLAITDLRAFDLFPMTQHVECLAVLEPA